MNLKAYRSLKLITASALIVALGALAAPAASAGLSGGSFGVRSQDSSNPSITGFSGSIARDAVDPGEGEPPATCFSAPDPTSFYTPPVPTGNPEIQYIAPGTGSSHSGWIDEVLESGGSFSFGAPEIIIDRVVVDGRELSNVAIADLLPSFGAVEAIPGGTIDPSIFPAWASAFDRELVGYGLFRMERPITQGEILALIESSSFKERIGLPAGSDNYIEATDLTVRYPVTVSWADGDCEDRSLSVGFRYHFGAE